MLLKDLCVNPGLENYDKGNDQAIFSLLESRFTEARRIAPQVLADALRSGEMNPSTRVHGLIDCFEELSQPQSIAM